MYRRPKFLEVLLDIRQEMAREADYDVDFFAEMVRTGTAPKSRRRFAIAPAETTPKAVNGNPRVRKLRTSKT